jgi:hypothetical protein
MTVSGAIIKCMESVFLHGLMAVDMKECTMTTKKKAEVFSHGQINANTTDSGKMENNTDLVYTILLVVMLRKADGPTVNVLNGSLSSEYL